MPSFTDSFVARVPPRAVWKVLHDPGRFPEWWAGLASVEEVGAAPPPGHDADATFTAFLDQSLFQDMEPTRPMVHSVRSHAAEDRVVISCLVADIEYDWRLSPEEGGRATRIDVEVLVPERRTNRYELLRTIMGASLRRLAQMVEAAERA
jgi:uncharacterized protein YndB with AHSA1/START domain